jgi:hypothetical protein
MTDRVLGYSDFSARVGQRFTMRFSIRPDGEDADGACEVELTECARSTVPGASRSFDLTFRAGPDAPREQGNYLLVREDFPPAPIFLVPVRALADGLEFHAVFNPLTEDENVL